MERIHYKSDIIPKKLYKGITDEISNLPWCRAPSGIPGNTVPRNVSVLGDGTIIKGGSKLICYHSEEGKLIDSVSYPLFQCDKTSSAQFRVRRIPINLAKFVIHLRKCVKKIYGDNVVDINRMFNIIICNNYTCHEHQISAHRDDERWLQCNEIDNDGNKCASIIASLTLYPDGQPPILRNFEVYDEKIDKWKTFNLEHNSMLFFSNHMHRAKIYPQKYTHVRRINLTFRTIAPGLLGRVGYGNFYRYMSIPYSIKITKKNSNKLTSWANLFINSANDANKFNNSNYYNTDIKLTIKDENDIKKMRQRYSEIIDVLPRYVKSLCSLDTLINYNSLCNV